MGTGDCPPDARVLTPTAMNATTVQSPTEHTPDPRPVRLVLLAYLVTVLLPVAGLLAALLVVTRPGKWAKRQAFAIVVLAATLTVLGIGLAPMLGDSYYAAREHRELNAVAHETARDEESARQMESEIAKSRQEFAVTNKHLERLAAAQRRERRRDSHH